MTLLKIISQQLVAGSDWNWTETIPGFPASQYTLKILLQKKNESTMFLEINGTPNGDSFDINVSASGNSSLTTGEYFVQAYLSGPSIKIFKQPDISISQLLGTGVDIRTENEIVLDNLKQVFTSLSKREVEEVTIDGWTYKYRDLNKLQGLINRYQERVNREKGLITGPKIYKSRFI